MTLFRIVVDNSSFIDLGHPMNKFTWIKNIKGGNVVKERLDLFFASDGLKNMFKSIKISHLNHHGSDHSPILTEVNLDFVERIRSNSKRKKLIRFEGSWENFKECKEIILKH